MCSPFCSSLFSILPRGKLFHDLSGKQICDDGALCVTLSSQGTEPLVESLLANNLLVLTKGPNVGMDYSFLCGFPFFPPENVSEGLRD